MKIIFILGNILLWCLNNSHAQSSIDREFQKVKAFYKSKGGMKNNTLYLNKAEYILEFNDLFQVPIMEVQITYFNDVNPTTGLKDHVYFLCKNSDDCIIYENDHDKGISTSFRSKADCYEFINLLGELKKAIKEGN